MLGGLNLLSIILLSKYTEDKTNHRGQVHTQTNLTTYTNSYPTSKQNVSYDYE